VSQQSKFDKVPANETSTCDAAVVFDTVSSHVKHFPFDQGMSMTPSGRFPSLLVKPSGSFDAGIFSSRQAAPCNVIQLTVSGVTTCSYYYYYYYYLNGLPPWCLLHGLHGDINKNGQRVL